MDEEQYYLSWGHSILFRHLEVRLAWNWASFVIFRFIGGLAVGGSSVVAPMYNAEISPARFRGRMVALTQFNIVFGVLLAFSSNYIISSLDLGDTTWRWMFGVEALPAITFFFLLFTNPRSPRWLIAQNRVEEARNVIWRLGADADNVEEEILEIQDSLKAEKDGPKEAIVSGQVYETHHAGCCHSHL